MAGADIVVRLADETQGVVVGGFASEAELGKGAVRSREFVVDIALESLEAEVT